MSESELPAQVRGLIDAAQRAPVRADRAAIRARIGTTLGTTAGATTAGALKLVVGAAITLVAVGGIYLAMRGGSSTRAGATPAHVESGPEHVAPAPSPIVAPVPEHAASAPSPIVEPPAPAPTVVEHPLPSATGHTPRTHVAPPAAPSQAAPATVDDEAALLANATRALAHGDYDQALGIVAEHARRFANGVLAEERGALELEALLGLGRGDEAAVAARRFASSYPHSVHAPLVERALHDGSSR